jgi:UDP-N-acetylglucosamine--N-acetylmuramyl-(pentapeptide) pyrophosphoryl-undecaprenol N-acetylglucosamine transferase
LPIINRAQAAGWTVFYVGSGDGPEKEIIEQTGIPFFPILCGKIRRERWFGNGISILRTLLGVTQALVLVSRLRPDVVFSKGGYVSVPVALAAWLSRVPLVIHESDVSPGLANRIVARFARYICTTFDETAEFFPHRLRTKIISTGMPLREEILRGDAERGRQLCGFTNELPCLLVMGGSLGSERINRVVESALPDLFARFQIAHLTGKGKALSVENHPRYRQFEFSRDIHHLLAMADVVVSRAGASSIIEILVARKPSILLPLSRGISRGEQIENAQSFAGKTVACVVEDHALSSESLTESVFDVLAKRENYLSVLARTEVRDGVKKVFSLLEWVAKHGKSRA